MVYFPYLPAKAELAADLELLFGRRGRYSESSFGVATRFPFAFLTKRREVPLRREIVVYPPVAQPDELFDILPRVRGEWESFMRGRGSELYRIREYMPEDSARHVDWKATAKSGSLKVREFSREDERKLCIVFDNPASGSISGPAYERAVNLAASLAWHFSKQGGEVSFIISGQGRCADVHEFLARLAVIEPSSVAQRTREENAIEQALREAISRNSDEYNIVLTARPYQAFPSALWNSAYFLPIANEVPTATIPKS
jgi:uncharacterized protein (DUF58 family)